MKQKINVVIIILFSFLAQDSYSWHCNITPLSTIIQNNPAILYKHVSPELTFERKKTPLTHNHYLHPYRGIFKSNFVVTIPNGKVLGNDGWVLINDSLISELIWQNCLLHQDTLAQAKNNPTTFYKGRVAVITQSGYSYYYHWMVEVLGRLALLELSGIEYDYVYIPTTAPFMKESLRLWGIDPDKIIEASETHIIQAEELIVPSLVSSVRVEGLPRLAHYIPSYLVNYIRNKLLGNMPEENSSYSKKIFISRQDASARKIINEDEVFALLAPHGFQRYHLTNIPFEEQIRLFKNAEIIIGSLGSGLTNLLFCNQEAQVIELYQARRDTTIWNLSQMIEIKNHYCIKTTEFIDSREGQYDTEIPLSVIQEVIETLLF